MYGKTCVVSVLFYRMQTNVFKMSTFSMFFHECVLFSREGSTLQVPCVLQSFVVRDEIIFCLLAPQLFCKITAY